MKAVVWFVEPTFVLFHAFSKTFKTVSVELVRFGLGAVLLPDASWSTQRIVFREHLKACSLRQGGGMDPSQMCR